MFGRLLGALVLVVAVSSCGAAPTAGPAPGDGITDAPPVQIEEPPSNDGGFRAPAQTEGEFAMGDAPQAVRGELRLAENGCWYASLGGTPYLVVFPAGSSVPKSDATVIVVPDHGTFRSGSPVDGTVRWVDIDHVPGGDAGRWGNYIAFCGPEQRSLVVFDSIEPAFDPDLLDAAAIEALVAGAEFTGAWPCGRGWWASTDDEMVGLFVYERFDAEPKAVHMISLPDAGWTAEVVVGKHLFVNHCDDVFENWEPEPVVAARWAITSGTIEILDDLPTGDVSAEIRARLSGGVVTTEAGREIPLDPVDLVNRSFNFFAG